LPPINHSSTFLVERLHRQAPDLDRTLAAACRLAKERGWSAWELEQSLDDLFRLSRGEDACYDRPSSGWAYALWYQARRTQDLVRVLRPFLFTRHERIRIVDLGAGTGATAWAVASLLRAALEAGLPTPKVELIAVEASQPMMDTGVHLWDELGNHRGFRPAIGQIDLTWQLASWTSASVGRSAHPTLAVASYLIDASDNEILQAVKIDFTAALEAMGANELVMTLPPMKALVGTSVIESLEAGSWQSAPTKIDPPLWHGFLEETSKGRCDAYRLGGVGADAMKRLAPHVRWVDSSTMYTRLHRVQPPADLFGEQTTLVRFDARQEAAATPDGRLTAIVGAAGSGKSHVLVERVARTVEAWRRRHGEPPRLLVTTYNRLMSAQLAQWLTQRLERGSGSSLQLRASDDWYRWRDPSFPDLSPSIDVVHLDKLAYADVRGWVKDDEQWRWHMQRLCNRMLADDALTPAQRRVLSPDFLLDELRRVIVAFEVGDIEQYVAVDRVGRRVPLQRGDIRRTIWELLHHDDAPAGFPHLRRAWLEHLRKAAANGEGPRYTHLFVDECQDLTQADLSALAHLVPDPNRIVITGDETQALHLGASYRRPGQLEIPEPYRQDRTAARRWHEHRLTGSHRLPVRVCQALRPLAEHMAADRQVVRAELGDVCLPDAMKPTVLGTRPIVVALDDADAVLPEIWRAYGGYAIQNGTVPKVTVAEEPTGCDRFSPAVPKGWEVEHGSMRTLKGLERWAVVWRTSTPIPDHETETEWVYTILTRSSALTIVVVDPASTSEHVRAAVRHLRQDRLLFWTSGAADAWRELVADP
jgi:DNA helicase II / ATP-dependent DNA helicase PcrA